MSAIYTHRQRGTAMVQLLSAAAALVAVLASFEEEGRWIGYAVAGVLILVMYTFSSLTIAVTPSEIAASFGTGWVRRTVRVAEVESARAVTNPWYYGWGIRMVPHGWLYNVAGRHAVELKLKSGRVVRLGTDEPERLLAAVRQVVR